MSAWSTFMIGKVTGRCSVIDCRGVSVSLPLAVNTADSALGAGEKRVGGISQIRHSEWS